MNYKNLIGQLPKIGIRPVIDGRLNGVRESLEETTMQMAKNTASFLEVNDQKIAKGSLVRNTNAPIATTIPKYNLVSIIN